VLEERLVVRVLQQADHDTRNLILYRVDPFLTDSIEPQHVQVQPALSAPAIAGLKLTTAESMVAPARPEMPDQRTPK